jgi:GNAT superfamily N-acetyltransferase
MAAVAARPPERAGEDRVQGVARAERRGDLLGVRPAPRGERGAEPALAARVARRPALPGSGTMAAVELPPGVEVRTATGDDRDELLELAQAFATTFAVEPSSFDQSLADVRSHPDSGLFVAPTSGRIVGYVLVSVHPTLYANGPVAWIEELMVRDASRRTGVGEQLVRAAEEWATDRGARMVALATRRAEEFWQAVGYEPSATYLRRLLDG